MGIKVDDIPKKSTYPYVGKSRINGMTVLFVSKKCGFTLKTGSDCDIYKQGEYRGDWFENNFTPIEYTITFDTN